MTKEEQTSFFTVTTANHWCSLWVSSIVKREERLVGICPEPQRLTCIIKQNSVWCTYFSSCVIFKPSKVYLEWIMLEADDCYGLHCTHALGPVSRAPYVSSSVGSSDCKAWQLFLQECQLNFLWVQECTSLTSDHNLHPLFRLAKPEFESRTLLCCPHV